MPITKCKSFNFSCSLREYLKSWKMKSEIGIFCVSLLCHVYWFYYPQTVKEYITFFSGMTSLLFFLLFYQAQFPFPFIETILNRNQQQQHLSQLFFSFIIHIIWSSSTNDDDGRFSPEQCLHFYRGSNKQSLRFKFCWNMSSQLLALAKFLAKVKSEWGNMKLKCIKFQEIILFRWS